MSCPAKLERNRIHNIGQLVWICKPLVHGEFVLMRYERQTAVHVYVHEHVHVNVHACDQIGKYMEANAGCPQWSVVVNVDVHVDVLVLVDVDGLDSFGPCN